MSMENLWKSYNNYVRIEGFLENLFLQHDARSLGQEP